MDASDAGEGNLEILVKSTKGPSVATRVEPLGNAAFGVSFRPEEATDHYVYITFNDENVPGTLADILLARTELDGDMVPFHVLHCTVCTVLYT